MIYFIGIEIAQSKKRILLTQKKYILDLLDETKHLQCKTNDSRIEVNHKFTLSDDDHKFKMNSYKKLIDKLLYLSHTRPDISYSINVLSQFMHSPRRSHFQADLQVLRYLKGATGIGLTFMKTDKLDLILYIDFDYAGSLIDHRFVMGYNTILVGNLVTWRSEKQSVISKSSKKAEFGAMSSGIEEVLWIHGILKDLKITGEPIKVFCDKKFAISIAHDPIYYDWIKHVNIDWFYIKKKLDEKVLSTHYIHSIEQCADIFTKGLLGRFFSELISKLGGGGVEEMEDPHISTLIFSIIVFILFLKFYFYPIAGDC